MKQLLMVFILGVVVCILMGSELYKPYKGVITKSETTSPGIGPDLKAIMMNQEAIFKLIEYKCGDK